MNPEDLLKRGGFGLEASGSITIIPEPRQLSRLHARALPQKDQLCGPFWASLVLSACGYQREQDEVALHSGTRLAEGDPAGWLPPGSSPRTDYDLSLPLTPDEASSGTSAPVLARSIEELSGGELAVVPVAGPWSEETVISLVEVVGSSAPACALIANLRTGRLWGSRPPAQLLLDHLLGHPVEAPPPDWDCGHFLTLTGCLSGPKGTLVAVRDTYPQLGWDGHHLQPAGAVAAALNREDGNEGGVLCACAASVVEALVGRLRETGFELRHWNNGTPGPDRP